MNSPNLNASSGKPELTKQPPTPICTDGHMFYRQLLALARKPLESEPRQQAEAPRKTA